MTSNKAVLSVASLGSRKNSAEVNTELVDSGRVVWPFKSSIILDVEEARLVVTAGAASNTNNLTISEVASAGGG